jgi:hypothetical protein
MESFHDDDEITLSQYATGETGEGELSMRRMLINLALLCCAVSCWAQSPQLEVFNPPTTGSGYTDLFNTILAKPHSSGMGTIANGIAVFLYWGNIDNGCQNSSCSGLPPSQVTNQTGTCNEPYCYWSNTSKTGIDDELLGYINGPNNNGLASHNQKLNLIIVPVPEGNTTSNNVPKYVFNPSTYSGSWCMNCSSLQPQDMATCGEWTGDASAPTGGGDGVWNANTCRMTTGSPSCPNPNNLMDTTGYPVLYEAPFMSAYRLFVQRVLKHYSLLGSGNGPAIGKYLSYIRVGLAEGGENQPLCTEGFLNSHNVGIWPSPAGLSYDLANNINPDWFASTKVCNSPPGPECQGKDAYLEGITYPPGYVKTIFGEMQNDLALWKNHYAVNTLQQIMANTHTGPPALSDVNYADREACIFAGNEPTCIPPGTYGSNSGFGMQALSEWDIANVNTLSGCTDNWCANFKKYTGEGLNLYLQTWAPNNEPAYSISSISNNAGSWVVTCTSTCTVSGVKKGLSEKAVVKIAGNSGTTGTFDIPHNGVLNATQFELDSALCTSNNNHCADGSGGTAYTADYIPDTVPFAVSNFADTLEIYFCDWEFAFSSSSGSNGCPAKLPPYSGYYASTLDRP